MNIRSLNRLKRFLAMTAVLLYCIGATAGVVEVRRHGAKGNGASDDSAAINRAIAALSPGSTLHFACGTYLISSALTPITRNHVVVTAPKGCATIRSAGSGYAAMLIQGSIGAKYPLGEDAKEGAQTVTADLQKLKVAPGDYLVISDNLQGSAGGNQQVVKVTSVSGSGATLADPISVTFTKSNGATLQKLESPITATVSNLIFDGSKSSEGLKLNFAVESRISGVTAKNYSEAAITLKYGYGNSISDTEVQFAGSGEGAALDVYAQSRMSIDRVSVTNSPANGFAIVLHQVNASKAQDVTVAQNGAQGRGFKVYRSNYNTIKNLNVSGTGGGKNGISVTTGSSHNTFENAVALNNTGLGIATFGDGNTDNTFINCIAKYNTAQQFFQVPGTDDRTTVSGGEFCCNRGAGFPVFSVNSHDFTLKDARIWDDNHAALFGLAFGNAQRPKIIGNVFGSLPAHADIDTGSAANGQFMHNTTPDGVRNKNSSNSFAQ